MSRFNEKIDECNTFGINNESMEGGIVNAIGFRNN